MQLHGVFMNIPTLSQSPFRLSSQPSLVDSQHRDQNRLNSGAQIPVNSAVVSRQEALDIFQRTLTMGYEKLQAKQQGPAAQFAEFEPLSAEKVAGNILGFIERRLQMDVAEGATQEQLQSRLEAGLAGFQKGFAEASEKLKALSMLSPEIEQDIGKTYDLVLSGIDALREKFLTDLTENEPVAPARAAHEQARTLMASSSYEYASASSFSFQLMTAEGDKVTISASASQAYAVDYRYAAANSESLTASYSSNSASHWSIQGDLNEAEMTAIEDLLSQVNDLAANFFNGNLDEAFNQALSLGYDQEQITAFSLNLTQVEVQRVSTAYKQFNDSPLSNMENDLSQRLLPLGQFVKDLLEALEAASVFSEPKFLLAELSEKVVAPDESAEVQPAERLRNFVEQILNYLD
jgi:hypothetical protein